MQVILCANSREHKPRMMHSESAPEIVGSPTNLKLDCIEAIKAPDAVSELKADDTPVHSPTTASEAGKDDCNDNSPKKSKTAQRNQRNRKKTKSCESLRVDPEGIDSAECQLERNGASTKENIDVTHIYEPQQTGPTRERRQQMREEMMLLCRDARGGSACTHSKPSVGELTVEELANYGVGSDRRLVSVYGQIFDVTNCTGQYGPSASQSYSLGKDISWDVLVSPSAPEHSNQFFDIFKTDDTTLPNLLQRLCLSIIRYENAYGAPVGHLNAFDQEETLPAPPLEQCAACTLM